MELPQRERLSELVEQLTTSGQSQLNENKMKEIKKICKYVDSARSLIDVCVCLYTGIIAFRVLISLAHHEQ